MAEPRMTFGRGPQRGVQQPGPSLDRGDQVQGASLSPQAFPPSIGVRLPFVSPFIPTIPLGDEVVRAAGAALGLSGMMPCAQWRVLLRGFTRRCAFPRPHWCWAVALICSCEWNGGPTSCD